MHQGLPVVSNEKKNESSNGTNGVRATSARPNTPQPSTEPARALRAEAAEFQPGRPR